MCVSTWNYYNIIVKAGVTVSRLALELNTCGPGMHVGIIIIWSYTIITAYASVAELPVALPHQACSPPPPSLCPSITMPPTGNRRVSVSMVPNQLYSGVRNHDTTEGEVAGGDSMCTGDCTSLAPQTTVYLDTLIHCYTDTDTAVFLEENLAEPILYISGWLSKKTVFT